MMVGMLVAVTPFLLNLKNFYFIGELSIVILVFFSGTQSMFFFSNSLILNDFFMGDTLSDVLVLLTDVIMLALLSASYSSVVFSGKKNMLFILICYMMLIFLILSFKSSELIKFYIYFESSLILIFLLVMGWGYQPERLQAAIYMLFYTLFASLPLLSVILFSQESFFSFTEEATGMKETSVLSLFIMLIFIFAFLVKLPMFFFHLWLPKAHVEAPVAGSMILAGVLLKLGSYGLWRVLFFNLKSFNLMSSMILILGLVGGVVVSFVCFLQVDMKCLVAYSSVVHMGILLGGMCTISSVGFMGALCLMVGHGVVSSGLFYLVGLSYDRIFSRSLVISKGLMVIFPSVTILWFILSIFNISAPPSVSLLGEIMLSSSILCYSQSLFLALMALNFLGMVFTFFLYAQSQQGKVNASLVSLSLVSVREFFVGWYHVALVVALTFMFWMF